MQMLSFTFITVSFLFTDDYSFANQNTVDLLNEIESSIKSLSPHLGSCDLKSPKLIGATEDLTLETDVGPRSVSVISEDEYLKILNEFRNNPKYAYGYSGDGCFARSYFAGFELSKRGIKTLQVRANLPPPNKRIESSVNHPNGRNFSKREKRLVEKYKIRFPLEISGLKFGMLWNYHIAPVVYVRPKNGSAPQLRVIDPSFNLEAPTLVQWELKLNKLTRSKLDFETVPSNTFGKRDSPIEESWDPLLLEKAEKQLTVNREILDFIRTSKSVKECEKFIESKQLN